MQTRATGPRNKARRSHRETLRARRLPRSKVTCSRVSESLGRKSESSSKRVESEELRSAALDSSDIRSFVSAEDWMGGCEKVWASLLMKPSVKRWSGSETTRAMTRMKKETSRAWRPPERRSLNPAGS